MASTENETQSEAGEPVQEEGPAEEEELRVSEPEENGAVAEKTEGDDPARTPGAVGRDGGGIRPRSHRMMEPAPPTYEEALTFFVKENSAGSSGGRQPATIADVASSANGSSARRPSLSDDYEMAERLQQEEIERCRPQRERSSSLGAVASLGGRPNRTERWSVSSAPGDARAGYRSHLALGSSLQSPRGRLRTIQEDEEMGEASTTQHHPTTSTSDSCSRACCYYSCFGFALFTDRLSPTLRQAWKEGMQQAIKAALPTFSIGWSYFFLCTQLLIISACAILSFASTPLEGENIVRNAALVACLIVNVTERFVSWCNCCGSKKDNYNAFSDITRNLLTDITLYPAVLASIINTLKTRSYNVVLSLWDDSIYGNASRVNIVQRDDSINFSMNLLVVLLFVVMVHLLRLWQAVRIAKTLIGEFKKNVSGARSASRTFLIGFFVHTLLWSIVQILYFCLIGYRLHVEMGEQSHPQVLGVSVYLFIMMVAGGLVPIVGIFMYFIMTQKWVEEFPIAFYLDRVPSQHLLSLTLSSDRVERQFKTLHETNVRCSGCLYGLIHPLVSPLQLILTTSFFAMWVLFAFSYPIVSLSATKVDLFLSDASHGLVGLIGTAIVYGAVVLLSFFGNILPLLYGFLGVAMFPFWLLFYTIVSCWSLCSKKS